jgi:hypothetical protein
VDPRCGQERILLSVRRTEPRPPSRYPVTTPTELLGLPVTFILYIFLLGHCVSISDYIFQWLNDLKGHERRLPVAKFDFAFYPKSLLERLRKTASISVAIAGILSEL